MNTPGWMHPQLLAFNPLQADRRIVHFKWDTEWDTLWATTRIPPLLVLDCMGYKADLSVSFNFLQNPASAGFLLNGYVRRLSAAPPGNLPNDTNSHICDIKHISLFSPFIAALLSNPDRYHKIYR